MVIISWSKSQEAAPSTITHVESAIYPTQFSFQMATIATPDTKQSEAYIATVALFAVFGSSKEDKVNLRLPPVFKDLWNELAEARKSQADTQDRATIKSLRTLVRQRQDQEEEDGVILQSAFKGRGANRNGNGQGDQTSSDRAHGSLFGPEYYQRIWAEKVNTPKFYHMLVSSHLRSFTGAWETNFTFSNLVCSSLCGLLDNKFLKPSSKTK